MVTVKSRKPDRLVDTHTCTQSSTVSRHKSQVLKSMAAAAAAAKLTLALKKHKWNVMPDVAALLCFFMLQRKRDTCRYADASTLRKWLNETYDICGMDAPFLFAEDVDDVLDMMVFSGNAVTRRFDGVKMFTGPNCFLKLYKLAQGNVYKTFVPSRAARHLDLGIIRTKTNVRIIFSDTCDTNDCMTVLQLHGEASSGVVDVQAALDGIRDQYDAMYSQVFVLRTHDEAEEVLPTPLVPRWNGNALYFRM